MSDKRKVLNDKISDMFISEILSFMTFILSDMNAFLKI